MSNREAADPERGRLDACQGDTSGWRRWGPYMAERAWASVREDYSPDGSAWDYFPHELARAKAYRWGEDGIAGICDRYQILCLAPAFWNEKDPILKERLFGVTGSEGNHGEDVKEYYFHLDNTPTHSYMRYLYKYPHAEFPYRQLVDANRARQGTGPEFELLDTGCFAENRYFDIEIEHAKADAEDICVRITATNRGPEPAPLHIIPQLWFRNRWGWDANAWEFPGPAEPVIRVGTDPDGNPALHADDTPLGPVPGLPMRYELGPRILQATAGAQFLFTNNETNGAAVYGPGNLSRRSHVKDAFHRLLVGGEASAVNPAATGTKAALHYRFASVAPGETVVVRLRMSPNGVPGGVAGVDEVIRRRRADADSFYAGIHPPNASADEKLVQRQAIAGLLWTKMVYFFNVHQWLDGDNPEFPPPQSRKNIRNAHWKHLNSMRIMIPAEKWEYPWFAAWDLAFTAIAVAVADPVFAKEQLQLLLLEQFQHPNGQIPAYEWEFSDLNPPVHAWAVW
ncbi:MAG: glucosidase, partial [Planctomycetota bacterium]